MPMAVSCLAGVAAALMREFILRLRQFPWEICGDARGCPY